MFKNSWQKDENDIFLEFIFLYYPDTTFADDGMLRGVMGDGGWLFRSGGHSTGLRLIWSHHY
jgi:hypothetical protein